MEREIGEPGKHGRGRARVMIPSPDALDMACRLMQHELGEREAPEEIAQGIEGCFRRLQQALLSFVGVAGFEALVGRAVRLARPEHRWLETAVVPARSSVIFEDLSGASSARARRP